MPPLINTPTWLNKIYDAIIGALIPGGGAVRVNINSPLAGDGSLRATVAQGAPTTGDPWIVNGPCDVLDVTLVLDTNIYADGDVLTVPVAIPNAVRANGKRLLLQSLRLVDTDDQGAALDIYLATELWTWGAAINAPLALPDADAKLLVTRIPIAAADYYDMGGSRIVTRGPGDQGMSTIIEAGSGTRSIYIGCVSRGTGTYSASGITLKLGVLWLD